MTQQPSRFAAIQPYTFLATGEDLTSRSVVERTAALMTALARAGATGILWQSAVFGRSLYPTRVSTVSTHDSRSVGRRLWTALDGVDLIDLGADAGHDAGLEVHIVARVYDDYFPGLGSTFEFMHQDALWESRDGEFRLRGVLSFAYDEVRQYRLEIINELSSCRADAIVVDVESSAAAMTPIRRNDFFGFNAPIAEAHRALTGEDIRAFDDVEYRRGSDLQIVDAVYAGPDFNHAVWHEVKGGFLAAFLAEASKLVRGKGLRLGFSRGREEGILPMARMSLPADKWLSEGLVDDLFLPEGAGRDRDFGAYLAARKGLQRVIDAKREDGGGTVADYREFLAR